jgi:hypothetical protein
LCYSSAHSHAAGDRVDANRTDESGRTSKGHGISEAPVNRERCDGCANSGAAAASPARCPFIDLHGWRTSWHAPDRPDQQAFYPVLERMMAVAMLWFSRRPTV